MEGVPDLLDLERRVWPSQVPSPEVRLAKRQIQKRALALPQNPTTSDCSRLLQITYRIEKQWCQPENLVDFSCAVIYHLLRRVLQESHDVIADIMGKTYPDVALGGHHGVHRTWTCRLIRTPSDLARTITFVNRDVEAIILK